MDWVASCLSHDDFLHTNLWIQVVEDPEHAPLVRTRGDVAEVVRTLDLLVPEPVGELQGDLHHGLETISGLL